MEAHVIGSFPSPLYRAFDKEEHAYEFAELGIFHLRPLAYYQQIEDANRRDKDEGEGRGIVQTYRPVLQIDSRSLKTLSQTNELGPVYFGTASINLRYILCFSGPNVDLTHLTRQYGRYLVRVNQPMMPVKDIAKHLERHQALQDWMLLDCIQVRYDKGQLVGELPEPASQDRIRMSYGQKAPICSGDCENRLVLQFPNSIDCCPVEVKVELRKKLEYVEILQR